MFRLELLQLYNDRNDAYGRAWAWHNKPESMKVHTGDEVAVESSILPGGGPAFFSHAGDESHSCSLERYFKSFFKNLLMVGACGREGCRGCLLCKTKNTALTLIVKLQNYIVNASN